ncbi:hypothetical protein C8T65DRAFT_577701 [Cerioporus squamosus]|nr:hypothetical protein C8T65DRAFT_577701 [Cerioporus squamosus]
MHRVFPGLTQDVTIAVAAYLDINALMDVRATLHAGDQLLAAEITRRSRRFLRPFVEDYVGFVNELHITGSVLSGQSALHILYPWHPPPPIPVVCALKGTFFHTVAYLVHAEHYTPSFSPPRPTLAGTWVDLTRSGCRMRIVCSPSPSPLEPIVCHWHTALFGYLRPAGFCIPYASLTTQKRALINARKLDDDGEVPNNMRDLRRAWRADGWRIWVVAPSTSRVGCRGVASADCATAHRYFGDRHCLSGPTQSLTRRDAPAVRYDAFAEWTVVWWRGGQVCNDKCSGGDERVDPDHRACPCVVLRT